MSYHIVNIDAANCSLTCRDGQLICKSAEGERKLPLEDVASIIITSWSASIHSNLILEAAKHGVALIICESFKPVSLMLPANRSTDTLLSRAQVALPDRVRQSLWESAVDAKCRNQWLLAKHMAPDSLGLENLRAMASSRRTHREAVCAKLFWRVFGRALGHARFARDRSQPGLNAQLNYGYAVLLSTVIQKLFAVGLDPTFGISHAMRERSTPLAYDLMEPFRPCVDWRVYQWAKEQPEPERDAVSKNYKRWVTEFVHERVQHCGRTQTIQDCIELSIREFRRAVAAASPRRYRPWTPKKDLWPIAQAPALALA